jgi:hypothetical protein
MRHVQLYLPVSIFSKLKLSSPTDGAVTARPTPENFYSAQKIYATLFMLARKRVTQKTSVFTFCGKSLIPYNPSLKKDPMPHYSYSYLRNIWLSSILPTA